MSFSTVGDMRQFFMTARANVSIRTELGTLVQELTIGQASDLTERLGAGQTKLSGIDRQLRLLDSFAQANVETGQMLSMIQTTLAGIDDQRELASSALLTINSASSSAQVQDTASIAKAGFKSVVHALNTRFGDNAVFGGIDQNSSPLMNADDMFAEIETAISGLTTSADISDAIDSWFDTSGGGFETIAFQGDNSGFISRLTESGQSVDIAVRADDQSFRDLFKSFAKGAVADNASLSIDLEARRSLLQQAGVDLLASASSLTSIRSRIGHSEALVEEASVRVAAKQTSYGIARNELVSADPFDTATRLEAVQLQLETQYTLTARLSRLSLTEYLR